jgi:hypothetical protein
LRLKVLNFSNKDILRPRLDYTRPTLQETGCPRINRLRNKSFFPAGHPVHFLVEMFCDIFWEILKGGKKNNYFWRFF